MEQGSAASSRAQDDEARRADERSLVEALLDGDEGAYDRLFAEYFPGVFRFALSRLGRDEELAQEMVQSTLVTAFERLETFRGEAQLMSWLCGICLNLIRDHRRRQGRRGGTVELDASVEEGGSPLLLEGLVDEREGPGDALERRQRAAQVHETLDLLSEAHARALQWKYIEGLPVREIAQRLAVGEKAAESLLTRARDAFRRRYQRLMRAV